LKCIPPLAVLNAGSGVTAVVPDSESQSTTSIAKAIRRSLENFKDPHLWKPALARGSMHMREAADRGLIVALENIGERTMRVNALTK
jgi:hypothetical protein